MIDPPVTLKMLETYLQDKSDIFSETEIYHVTKPMC